MLKQLTLLATVATLSLSAFAFDHTTVEKTIPLKDDSTLVVFRDGKMGMEDQYGRPLYMKEGHVMETRDGQQIVMRGNEAWRLEQLRWQLNN